jgi:hypothetical protein
MVDCSDGETLRWINAAIRPGDWSFVVGVDAQLPLRLALFARAAANRAR